MNKQIIVDRVMRFVGFVAAVIVLANALFLLTIGGTAEIVAATPFGAPPATPILVREPVYRAVVPLLGALVGLWGCLRGDHRLMIGGGIALVVIGIAFMWSLGVWIAFAGLVVVVAAGVSSTAWKTRS